MQSVTLENVELIFRNFAGNPTKFDRKGGRRGFSVLLGDEVAAKMKADGWNVKYLKPREEGDIPRAYLNVKVRYDGYKPPRIILVSSAGQTLLSESDLPMLDWAEFSNVDIIINPYEWVLDGESGVSAYLKTMYATVDEDDLDMKYAEA